MEKEIISNIKKRIKELQTARNMSDYQLAIDAGLTDACINNWFSKRGYIPSLESLIKVSKAFNISLCELFADENQEFYPLNSDLKEMVNYWTKLNNNQKRAIIEIFKNFIEN